MGKNTRNAIIQNFLSGPLKFLIKGLSLSYDFHFSGLKNLSEGTHPEGGYILALWHENITTAFTGQLHNPHCLLVSPSEDGNWIAKICQEFSFTCVRGSSSRGGVRALLEVQKFLKNGIPLAVAVDGPRGPRHKCQAGIFHIAKHTQRKIIPITPVTPHSYVLQSWDNHKIPQPFSSVIYHFGTPLQVPNNINNYESFRQELTRRLYLGEEEARLIFRQKFGGKDYLGL